MSDHHESTPIRRREFLKLSTAALAAAAVGRASAAGAPAKRPNIIFVFSDEHRWCSLPFTQMPELVAPAMARLAREGTRFDHCYSTSSICVPYRGMLITGQWPHQSSVLSNDYFGDTDVIGVTSPTIAHTFKRAGYVTGYVGKWHLRNETCIHAGFDEFQHWQYGDNHVATPVRDVIAGEDFHTHEGYNATGMTDQALDFIGRHAGGDKPFLMMLSINPPHFRWDDAPEDCLALYPEEEIPFRPNVTDPRHRQGTYLRNYRHYHAHITAVDRELGRLMEATKRLGIDEDTVIIYTSDHGSSFGSNGFFNKSNPYDEASRVPMLVRWPGTVPSGRVVESLMGSIDVYPSLCGLAGITPPSICGGEDYAPAMLGGRGPEPASTLLMVNNFVRNYIRTRLEPGKRTHNNAFRGVRTKRYTYVIDDLGEWQLFDNVSDPYQLNNLIDDPAHAAVRAELRGELDRWLAKAEEPFIPDAWRRMSLPERIAWQNEHYAVMRHKGRWDRYKADALAPYLERATTDRQRAELRVAVDRLCDQHYYGLVLAIDNELNGRRRWTRRPPDELRAELAAHEADFARRLEAAWTNAH